MLDLHDVTTEALVHRDLDVVHCLLTTAADSDNLDGRARLVGRRDQDATTRELHVEGDAPGRFEGMHREPLDLVAVLAPSDPSAGRTLARAPYPRLRIDECRVVEGK
jgi:hypothetical protein